VLILSEFAGAAEQLAGGALLVNPYDIEGVSGAIRQAYSMPSKERAARMRRMRRAIQRQDVFWWVETYMGAALGRGAGSARPGGPPGAHAPELELPL
jgi:trehalose 6-phosphate synthase